jgi:hypothetical protein
MREPRPSGVFPDFFFFQPRFFQGVPDPILFGGFQAGAVFSSVFPVHPVQQNPRGVFFSPACCPGMHGFAAEVAPSRAVFPNLRYFQRRHFHEIPGKSELGGHLFREAKLLLFHQGAGESEKMDRRRGQSFPSRPGKAGTIHASRKEYGHLLQIAEQRKQLFEMSLGRGVFRGEMIFHERFFHAVKGR